MRRFAPMSVISLIVDLVLLLGLALGGAWPTVAQAQPGFWAMPVLPVPSTRKGSVAEGLPLEVSSTAFIYLYNNAETQNLGVAEDWERGMTWASDGQAEVVTDPKGIFGQVARVYVRGYGHGTETSWISASQGSIHGPLTVPSGADVIAIPLASAFNGDVNETDADDGVEIAVYHPASGQTVMTYASHIFETELEVSYIVAFADVSEFQGGGR